MNLNVAEKFNSIQAEGRHVGLPVVFLRLQNCTRKCIFCDTQYHKIGKPISIVTLAKQLSGQSLRTIVISGGEPLLQWEGIVELWRLLNRDKHFSIHLETNGDLLCTKKVGYSEVFSVCSYVAISPKEMGVAKQLYKDLPGPLSKGMCDLKVVTDIDTIGKSMLQYATILMPLTTCNEERDMAIRKRVWEYCTKNGIRYTPRLHVELFGPRIRGV